MMWCSLNKSRLTVALTCMVAASVVSSDMTFAARQRNYKPDEFRSVLRGLGYNVKVTKDGSSVLVMLNYLVILIE